MRSQTIEDYIRAIYLLTDKSHEISSKEVASYLGVRKSTFSEMLAKLKDLGLVICKKYSKISLAKKGRSLAERLTFKHRVIEAFLTQILKRKKSQVHEEANRLEHAFSDESIRKLYSLVGKPSKDPHGETIPKMKF